MCGTVRIDIDEFPQTVRCVVRCDQAAFEVFQCLPFGVERVGITDVEVHTGSGPERIVLGQLGEVDRHRPAVGKTIAFWTFVAADIESESAVAVEGDIKVSDRDDR